MSLLVKSIINGQTFQIKNLRVLQQKIDAGRFGPDDLIAKSPNGPWRRLDSLSGLSFAKTNTNASQNSAGGCDDGYENIFSGPIGSYGEAIEEEEYELYGIPAKSKSMQKNREEDFNPRTGEGKYRRLVENNEKPNKVFMLIHECWHAVPTFIKLLSLVLVLSYLIVIMPLMHFQEETYWDEGGPYGHNTTDTIYMAKARGGGHNDVAEFHLARREFRKAIVRIHRRLNSLVDDGVVKRQEASNYQSVLESIADEFLLPKNIWGKDMFGINSQTSNMTVLATKANSFADSLTDPDTVAELEKMLKQGRE